MSENFLQQAADEWDALVRRVNAAVDIGWTGFQGLTWDLFTKGKTPNQVLNDIRAKAESFEAAEKAHRAKNSRRA